jgi:hypothetical protein
MGGASSALIFRIKKHLKTLDSLIEVKTKEIEDAFKSFKDSKKKNT